MQICTTICLKTIVFHILEIDPCQPQDLLSKNALNAIFFPSTSQLTTDVQSDTDQSCSKSSVFSKCNHCRWTNVDISVMDITTASSSLVNSVVCHRHGEQRDNATDREDDSEIFLLIWYSMRTVTSIMWTWSKKKSWQNNGYFVSKKWKLIMGILAGGARRMQRRESGKGDEWS